MTRVLLVEDNLDVLDAIRLELEMNGYEVDQAIDGQMALDLLTSTDALPEIIISDITMPNVDGYELLATCKRHPQWSSIPFIFLTALSTHKDIQKGKKLGADDYLVKPFQHDELIRAVKNQLRRVDLI